MIYVTQHCSATQINFLPVLSFLPFCPWFRANWPFISLVLLILIILKSYLKTLWLFPFLFSFSNALSLWCTKKWQAVQASLPRHQCLQICTLLCLSVCLSVFLALSFIWSLTKEYRQFFYLRAPPQQQFYRLIDCRISPLNSAMAANNVFEEGQNRF